MTKEFLNEHSFEEIHGMLDKLYSGWAGHAAVQVETEERLKTLIFFDELKQFFEKMEGSN
nr:hypothetical protein [Pedobacter panaciterrae]